jgi:hypothetical protein
MLHAVSLGPGGDVDHLLIGPFGVFTVNTKHRPGAVVQVCDRVVFVRGRQQPYIGKAGREAARVRTALSSAAGRPCRCRAAGRGARAPAAAGLGRASTAECAGAVGAGHPAGRLAGEDAVAAPLRLSGTVRPGRRLRMPRVS